MIVKIFLYFYYFQPLQKGQVLFCHFLYYDIKSYDYNYIINISMWIKILFLAIVSICICSASVQTPSYTEDLQVFTTDKKNARMQLLVGCWLMARDHTNSTNQAYQLTLIKQCMKKITRKDSVLKITQLIGKNKLKPKTLQQIIPPADLPLEIGDYHNTQYSDFDFFLLQKLKTYENDLPGVKGKQGEELIKKMDEEISKRTKYYFGIIPANQFTHLMFLISIALFIVMICTCWKYYKNKSAKKEQQKISNFKKNGQSNFTKSKTN